MRRLLRRFAFDVRHGDDGHLLDGAECALADLTRAPFFTLAAYPPG